MSQTERNQKEAINLLADVLQIILRALLKYNVISTATYDHLNDKTNHAKGLAR